ncbi:SusD/RagB family nutrient-binding outer membrane lipoprotein [Prolixibacteraceae bacterium JC049]|nr:SusD/RagB family nutrient-binding outer membrane lipoprotein [Prolixibacteraceae bacterium JC049]
MKKLIYLLAFIVGASACTDRFADINTNPSVISDPSIVYLMTNTMRNISKDEYYRYYHQMGPRIFPTLGYTTQGNSGNSYDMNRNFKVNTLSTDNVFAYTRDIQHRIDQLPEDEKAYYQGVKGISYVLQVIPSMVRFEDLGEQKYTQAGMAPYTNPPLLKVPFDSEETIINKWLEELNLALEGLTADSQTSLGSQDIFYGGDYTKWAKLCNSLKLKIAVLLVNKDKAKAIKIAEEVIASKAGFVSNSNEDFFFRLEDEDRGDGSGWNVGPGSRSFVSFLRRNKDPRLFLLFTKNEFNPGVIQEFIKQDVALPKFLLDDIVLDADGNFKSWANEGEPWVRYHGMPTTTDVAWKALPENKCYFDIATVNVLKDGDKEKSYSGVSEPQMRLWQPNYRFYYPTLPSEGGNEYDRTSAYDQQLYMSASESYMYLAELKLIGAELPESAEFYLKKGVGYSFDRLYAIAERNKIPYFDGDPYYNDDEATNLHRDDALIAKYMDSDLLDLSVDGLEKVYIQQYIDRFYRNDGQWNLFKRSGIPKVNSAYLPWEPLSGDINALMPIARRPYVEEPSKTNTNYDNIMESYKRRGFTLGTKDPSIMAGERQWWDSENPAFHTGPKN